MMKRNELVLPVPQVMGATNSMSSAHSSSRLDHKTVEALTGLLQEMTVTIQTLTNRHNMACQNYKSCALQDVDMCTSFSKGLSISLELPSAAVNVSPTQSRDRDSMPVSFQSLCRTVNGSHALKPHYLEANLLRTQDGMNRQGLQAKTSTVAVNGRCSSAVQQEVKTRKMDTGMISFEGQTRKRTSEPNCRKHSLDAKTVDALRCFLEEMKRTIQVWSIRHRLLVQGHAELRKENADMPESTHFNVASMCCVDPPIADGLHCLSTKSEVEAVINKIQPTNGRAFTLGSNQPEIEFRIQLPAQAHSEVCEEHKTFDPDDQVSEGESGRSQHGNHLKGQSLEVVEQSPQVDHLRSISVCDRGVDCSLVPWELREEPEKCVSATGGERLPQISTSRVVKVVESPDWLPYGWITEVKTRARGNSAGTKDKYYFDPVSKRRFRSRKEVFCYLTTGKLGRYKPKPKVLCNELVCDRDCISSGQTTGAYALLNKQSRPSHSLLHPLFSPSDPVASMSCPSSFSSAPSFSSNFFAPCKPSNHPDWLMQESIVNLAAPVHKHFQCPQPDAIKQKGFRVFNEQCSEGPIKFMSSQNEVNGTTGKDMLRHCSQGLHTLETEQNHNLAGCSGLNIAEFRNGSYAPSLGLRQTVQPQGSVAVFSDGGCNFRSQLAFGKWPQKIETNYWGKKLRSSSIHDHGVGLKLPTKKIKKGKSHGKEVLEALGRVICRQGVSFLRGCKKPNVCN